MDTHVVIASSIPDTAHCDEFSDEFIASRVRLSEEEKDIQYKELWK